MADSIFDSELYRLQTCWRLRRNTVRKAIKAVADPSGGWGEGARNMKSMRPPLVAIFLWLILTGPWGDRPSYPPLPTHPRIHYCKVRLIQWDNVKNSFVFGRFTWKLLGIIHEKHSPQGPKTLVLHCIFREWFFWLTYSCDSDLYKWTFPFHLFCKSHLSVKSVFYPLESMVPELALVI